MCKFDLHRWKEIFEIIKLQKLERKFQYVNWTKFSSYEENFRDYKILEKGKWVNKRIFYIFIFDVTKLQKLKRKKKKFQCELDEIFEIIKFQYMNWTKFSSYEEKFRDYKILEKGKWNKRKF